MKDATYTGCRNEEWPFSRITLWSEAPSLAQCVTFNLYVVLAGEMPPPTTKNREEQRN